MQRHAHFLGRVPLHYLERCARRLFVVERMAVCGQWRLPSVSWSVNNTSLDVLKGGVLLPGAAVAVLCVPLSARERSCGGVFCCALQSTVAVLCAQEYGESLAGAAFMSWSG